MSLMYVKICLGEEAVPENARTRQTVTEKTAFRTVFNVAWLVISTHISFCCSDKQVLFDLIWLEKWICRRRDSLVVHISDIFHIYRKRNWTPFTATITKLRICYCRIVLLHIIKNIIYKYITINNKICN